MNNRIGVFLGVVLFAVAVGTAGAQSLPVLKQAPQISDFYLPNGVRCYIASCTHDKGFADFAVVQRLESGSDTESALKQANLRTADFTAFLRNRGIAPGPDGIISRKGGCRIVSFQRVPVAQKAALDSALLILTDFSAKTRENQAFVIAGDIDPKETRRTLEVLSMTVPTVKTGAFEPVAAEEESVKDGEIPGMTSVKFHRTALSKDKMSTPVPLFSELMCRELGEILSYRVTKAFRSAGIPFCETHDRDGFTLRTFPEDSLMARNLLRGIFADLREGHILADEIAIARHRSIPLITESGLRKTDGNARHLQKCIDSYIFGTNLASEQTLKDLFAGRRINTARELEIFRNFASAVLPPVDSTVIPLPGASKPVEFFTLYPEEPGRKLKVLSEDKENVGGGKIWTFSNGMKVIWNRKGVSSEEVNYTLILKGSHRDLERGQSAYLTDCFDFLGAGSLSPVEFRRSLSAEGISLSARAGLSELTIRGGAQGPKALEKALVCLEVLSTTNTFYRSDYDFFRKCERVKDNGTTTLQLVDSLFCPGFKHPKTKRPEVLTDEFASKASAYYRQKLGNLSDGVLVIYADMEEEQLLKELRVLLSTLPTGEKNAVREIIPYSIRSGSQTLRIEGEQKEMCQDFCTTLPVSKKSYLTALVAEQVITDMMGRCLLENAAWMEAKIFVRSVPSEMFRLHLSFRPVPDASLPEDFRAFRNEESFDAVARMAEDLCNAKEIQDIGRAKALVSARVSQWLEQRTGLDAFLTARYSRGKDLTTDLKATLDSITQDDVKAMLKALCEAPQIRILKGDD